MATRPQRPVPHRRARSPLTESIITLAGTPDDHVQIATKLILIAQLAADLVPAVDFASVTAHGAEGYTTVAASAELALAVDEAQYADGQGPCLDALVRGIPVPVPSIGATMVWPGFRDTAYGLGIRASLSIPIFAGRGSPLAALNLYGRDPATMAPLIDAVRSTYDVEPADRPDGGLDAGGTALVAGFTGAFAVRSVIQQAIGVLIARQHGCPDDAYLSLRARAAQQGRSLPDTATAVIAERR